MKNNSSHILSFFLCLCCFKNKNAPKSKKHMVIQQLYKEEELFTANCTLNRSMPMKLDVFAKNIEGNVLAWLVTEK